MPTATLDDLYRRRDKRNLAMSMDAADLSSQPANARDPLGTLRAVQSRQRKFAVDGYDDQQAIADAEYRAQVAQWNVQAPTPKPDVPKTVTPQMGYANAAAYDAAANATRPGTGPSGMYPTQQPQDPWMQSLAVTQAARTAEGTRLPQGEARGANPDGAEARTMAAAPQVRQFNPVTAPHRMPMPRIRTQHFKPPKVVDA